MKKFFMLTMLMACFCFNVSAKTWTVQGNGHADFSGIQEAIADSDVVSGDTIEVFPGVYRELICVPAEKRLTIRSVEGFKETIIRRPELPVDGPKMTVLIKSQSIFEGFTVDDPRENMERPITLHDIPGPGQFPENTAGITLTGPAKILNNYVKGYRYGILQECPSGAWGIPPSIRYNIAEYNDIGICCCETYSEVRDNIAANNRWIGILSAHSSCDDIVNNLVVGNGTIGRESSCGILCWQSYTWRTYDLTPRIAINTISGNEGDGIICIWEKGAANRPIIEHSIITSNSGAGIRVVPTDDIRDLPKPRVFKCNVWGNLKADSINVDRLVDCISLDPMLTDTFELNSGSPCIDRGNLPENWGSAISGSSADRHLLDLGFHQPPRTVRPSSLDE